jgi:rare lipoprotein A
MAGSPIKHIAFWMMSTAALSGCESVSNPFAEKTSSDPAAITTEAAKSVRLVDRDIEAPEVFQTNDTALWDGRPSLGGVWVASPDAVNPERVILRNEANGKFVIGALFRRERDNPGPKLQISSDAADALGMLAGQPSKLNVTALRRQESKPEEVLAAPAVMDPTATGDEETLTADPLAAAGAALDRADGASAATENADPAAVAPPVQDALDPTPRPGETKRQARKRVRAARAAAAKGEVLPDAATIGSDAPLAAPVPALEVAPLPNAAAEVSAAPADAGGSARVQIGIFSVEANAQRAADKLKEGGVSADLRKEESNGKVFWSVVANGKSGSKALLAKVKELGFTDAYVVSG